MPAGPRSRPGTRDPHDGLSAADGGVRRRLHLRDARRPASRSASSRASTIAIRCSIRTSRFSTSSSIRSSRRCSTAGRWCATARRRCPKAAGTRSRSVYADGALIAGDAGGFLNSLRLKGIHLAMRTGMLAAETAFDAVRAGDTSAARAEALRGRDRRERRPRASCIPVRNVHQSFSYGLLAGVAYSGLSLVTGGWWFAIRCRRTPATSGCRSSTSTTRTAAPDPDSPVRPGEDRSPAHLRSS